ncbi:MAG: LLM class flavin-dependent oxidoreductase, partial [Chloroflexota bacterium]
ASVGFHYLSFGQHLLSHPVAWPQPFPLIARLAPHAGDMRLVCQVLLLPMHNPAWIAEEVATLDHICHGRFVLACGLGYRKVELEASGIQKKERVSRLVEGLELMTQLWSGEEVTFHGRYYHITSGRMGFTPLQKPRPPIWLASQSHGAAARAARLADGCIISPVVGWDDFRALAKTYQEEFHKTKRPGKPILAASRYLILGSDPRTAIQDHIESLNRIRARYQVWDMREKTMVSVHLQATQDTADEVIAGRPSDCIETLKCYEREAGLEYVTLTFPDMPKDLQGRLEYIEMFGKEIIQKYSK